MGSMRVHELAKEFEMTSKELLDRLHEMKIPAKSHASMLAWDFAGIFISWSRSRSSLLVISNSLANSCTRMLPMYHSSFSDGRSSVARDISPASRS